MAAEISDESTAPLLSSEDTDEEERDQPLIEEPCVPFLDIQKAAYLVDQALARRLMPLEVSLLVTSIIHMISSVPSMSWLLLNQSHFVGVNLFILIPIFFSRSLRDCFRMTMRIGHSFLDTAGLLVVFILISAWVANQLFHNTNFKDFSTSLLSLFVMLTTANNPNVWVETYEDNRAAFFFFFIYMLIAFFFLMQLLFALIYNNYKIQLANECDRHTNTRRQNLRAAFDLLNVRREGINVPNASRLFFEIGSYRRVHELGALVQEILSSLKFKDDDKIIFGDFLVLCSRFVKAIEAKLHGRPPDREYSQLGSKRSPEFLRSVGYNWISFLATFASLVVAFLDYTVRGSKLPNDVLDLKSISYLDVLTKCEFALGWLFLADLVLKLYSQGIRSYWRNFLNCFDFATTLIIICLQISTIWYKGAYNWIPTSIVVRSMRVFTLLSYVNRWRVMGHLLLSMIPATMPILGFQFCVCSLFSVAGVQLFGGFVYEGNPSLEGTEYKESGLWVYNYNDYGSAMVTAFNLCVVNNWYVIMNGYVAATGSDWARAYFVLFWAIAVTFTLNVVVAFFVGAFTAQMQKAEQMHAGSILGSKSSKRALLSRRRAGTSMFMGYSGVLSKYDLYEEISKN